MSPTTSALALVLAATAAAQTQDFGKAYSFAERAPRSRVEQTIDDPAAHGDWRLRAEVDLEASAEAGTAVLREVRLLRL